MLLVICAQSANNGGVRLNPTLLKLEQFTGKEGAIKIKFIRVRPTVPLVEGVVPSCWDNGECTTTVFVHRSLRSLHAQLEGAKPQSIQPGAQQA